MTDIRPTDLPEMRAEAIDDAQFMLKQGYRTTAGRETSVILEREIERLRAAELFYVADGMAELADTARRSLPHFQIQPEDLPATSGLLVLAGDPLIYSESEDDSAGRMTIRAVCWGIHNDPTYGMGVLISRYTDRGDYTRVLGSSAVNLKSPIAGLYGTNVFWPFALDPGEYPESLRGFGVSASMLRSCWLLMQQPLAESDVVEPDRAARKRLKRAGHEPRPVRVIELRRPKSSGDQGDGESNYQHQWIVRGHWRNHWHPKREVHRPVWIAPHVKGPEGAPMIGGEKVYAWKR